MIVAPSIAVYRLGLALLLLMAMGAAVAHGQLATSDPRHFSQPGPQAGSGGSSHMGTTRGGNGSVIVARYETPFRDSVEADQAASRACAEGQLKPKLPGRFRVVFGDREVEAVWLGRAKDRGGVLEREVLYVLTGAGSTACTVWRVVR